MRFAAFVVLVLVTSGLGQSPPESAAVLGKLDPKAGKEDRLAAVKWLRSNPAGTDAVAAIPALERLVRADTEADVRRAAVAALAQVARKHKRPCPLALIEAVRDPVDEVRWEAGTWVVLFKKDVAAGGVEGLLAAAADDRAEVRTWGLGLLGGAAGKDAKVLVAIEKAKADPVFDVRHSAHCARFALTDDLAEFLAYHFRVREEPDEVLKPLPQDPERRKAEQVQRNMVLIGGPRAAIEWADARPDELAKALLKLLDDASPGMRRAAADLIRMTAQAPRMNPFDRPLGAEQGAEWLQSLLPYIDPGAPVPKADPLPPPRPSKAAGRFRELKVDARLRRLAADDPDETVRAAAKRALERLAETPELLAIPPRVVR